MSNSNAVETEEYRGHTIEIFPDENPLNPRTDWDNLTEFHVKSSRYFLGEHEHRTNEDLFETVKEAKEQGDMVFPLFAYIHSGIVLSLASFDGKLPQGHAEFDSGQCGFVIVRKDTMMENFKKDFSTEEARQHAYDIAKSDVETFNAYLCGSVYGYVVSRQGEEDHRDSCWGYYEIEEAMAEAQRVVDYLVRQDRKRHFKQLKTWIQNHVPLSYRHSMKAS